MHSFMFTRHGATAFNLNGRWCGSGSDVPLAPEGFEQARQLGQRSAEAGLRFGLIISSPLSRAMVTAQQVAEATNYAGEIMISPLFAERRFGSLEGQPHDPELMKAYRADETAVDGFGGESFAQLQQRATAAAKFLLDCGEQREPILVSGHATHGRRLYSVCTQTTLSVMDLQLPHAELVEFPMYNPEGNV